MKTLRPNAGKLVETVVRVCTGCVAAFLFPRNPSDFRACLVLRRASDEILCKSATIAQAAGISKLRRAFFFSGEQSASQPQAVNLLACRLLVS
jgi:hypothetical protein